MRPLRELIVGRLQYIPQVNFADLQSLNEEEVLRIKRRGSVIVKDVVPDEQAMKWKEELKEFVAANPTVEGNSIFWRTNC